MPVAGSGQGPSRAGLAPLSASSCPLAFTDCGYSLEKGHHGNSSAWHQVRGMGRPGYSTGVLLAGTL